MRWLFQSREARPASVAWNVGKSLAQTAVFWALFLFILPAAIYRLESMLFLAGWRFDFAYRHIIAVLLFITASALGIASCITMAIHGCGTPLPVDCPRRLVVTGPYRFVRNPMAIAGLTQGAAVGMFLGSPLVLLYVLAGGVLWNVAIRPWEERDMEKRFGESFERYRSSVRCWWPSLSPPDRVT